MLKYAEHIESIHNRLYWGKPTIEKTFRKTNLEKSMYKAKYENLKSLIKKAKMERERKRESVSESC